MEDKFAKYLELPEGQKPKKLAVAAAEGFEVLSALNDAVKLGIVEPILVGDEETIESLIAEHDFALKDCEIIDSKDHKDAAAKAVALVREGRAQALMKGVLVSSILMKAILNKETGIRASDTLNIVSFIDSPLMDRLLFLTDAGMVMYPTLEQKIDLINNTVAIARNLGVECPKVACVCALELVNPKMQPTMDAAVLSMMSQRGQFKNCVVDGPFQLDNALLEEAVKEKGVKCLSGVAGHADVLLMPNIETGNIVNKALRFLGGCSVAGIMVGASAPVIMSSRSDPPINKLRSIAIALAAAN